MTSTQLNDACLDWILRMGLQDLVAAADLTFTLEYPPEWSGKISPMAWFQDIWDSPKVQKYRQALEQREHPVAQAPVVEEVPVSDF